MVESPSPRIIVHNTDIGAFKTCRTRWSFTSPLRRNLEPVTPVQPLAFGTIWHEALAAYYGSAARQLHLAQDAIHDGFNAWEAAVPDLGPEDEEELKLLRELCHGMLSNYAKWAPTVDDFEVVWVERAYEIPLDMTYQGVPIVYGFKPDGLAQDSHGRLWIMEHKSANKLPGDRHDYLLTDDQVGRYLWGLSQVEPPVEIEGVIYTISRKAAPGPLKTLAKGGFSTDKRQTTTFDIASAQLKAEYPMKIPPRYNDYLDYLQERGYSNFFFRLPVRRNKAELENVGRSLKAEAYEMVNDPHIHRTSSPFNCGSCAFVGPCLTLWEGRDVELALAGSYQERVR